jgi:MFS family permease
VPHWSQRHLGFTPENALIGILGTAFMVVCTLGAPVFGRLAERHSRWRLVGIGVVLWSLARDTELAPRRLPAFPTTASSSP